MICVINFHYQVFINLFILCHPDASLLGVYHHLGCVCVFVGPPGVFFFFPHLLKNVSIMGNFTCVPGEL